MNQQIRAFQKYLSILVSHFGMMNLSNLDCIFWHNLSVNGGRTSSGWLHQIKSSCKMKYKLAIKEAYLSFENKLDDVILQHFVNKRMPDFWKVWII
jgi:hypothetical protein